MVDQSDEVERSWQERKLDAFVSTLNRESDRGCALTASAMLDEALLESIESCLVDDEEVASQLFRSSGPIGTFSARTDLAHVLGLLSPNVRRDLILIRKIRNQFAHSPIDTNFETQEVSNRCTQLKLGSSSNTQPRRRFVASTAYILGFLHGILGARRRPVVLTNADNAHGSEPEAPLAST